MSDDDKSAISAVVPTSQKGKKSKKAKRRELSERRYVGAPSTKSKALLGLLFAGAIVLGAGVYARFVMAKVPSYATYLVAGGALLVAIYILLVPEDAPPLLVGDGGVGEEHGEGAKRLPWCDFTAVTREGKMLVLSTEEAGQLRIATDQHGPAAARILAELDKRLGEVLEISDDVKVGLPAVNDADGEVRKVTTVQSAGRKCAASGRVLSFEADVRTCGVCGQVYHAEALPEICVTCGAPLTQG